MGLLSFVIIAGGIYAFTKFRNKRILQQPKQLQPPTVVTNKPQKKIDANTKK